MNTKKYIAELLGTFALTLVVGLSLAGNFPVPTPILAALVLGLFVYSIGHISGTHINPAVTIGLWSIKKISTNETLAYIIAQFVGGFIAFLFIQTALGVHSLVVVNSLRVCLAEILGTLFFTFGIASVVYGKTPSEFGGIVVGGSLLLGITIAALIGSNGVLNPAVALGIGSFNFTYLFAPILGSIAGMNLYKYLCK